jgi:hypothetical protein
MNKGKSFLLYPWSMHISSVISKYFCLLVPLSTSEVGLIYGWLMWPSVATGTSDVIKPSIAMVALSSNGRM